jgi:hypothetical protein
MCSVHNVRPYVKIYRKNQWIHICFILLPNVYFLHIYSSFPSAYKYSVFALATYIPSAAGRNIWGKINSYIHNIFPYIFPYIWGFLPQKKLCRKFDKTHFSTDRSKHFKVVKIWCYMRLKKCPTAITTDRYLSSNIFWTFFFFEASVGL